MCQNCGGGGLRSTSAGLASRLEDDYEIPTGVLKHHSGAIVTCPGITDRLFEVWGRQVPTAHYEYVIETTFDVQLTVLDVSLVARVEKPLAVDGRLTVRIDLSDGRTPDEDLVSAIPWFKGALVPRQHGTAGDQCSGLAIPVHR